MPDRDKTETDQGDCARSVQGDSTGYRGISGCGSVDCVRECAAPPGECDFERIAEDAVWAAREGRVQTGSVAFMRAIREHEGFWLVDSALKYLDVHIDTRDGDRFTLSDRDKNPIDGVRVARAMATWREKFGPSSGDERWRGVRATAPNTAISARDEQVPISKSEGHQ